MTAVSAEGESADMATVDDAIAAVRGLTRELGLAVEVTLLADRSNTVLRLDSARGPLVARVAMATSLVRVGVAWLRREVEIARFLEDGPARSTIPARSIDPGPHERDGLVISFWELEELTGAAPDPREAGLGLAAAHRELGAYRGDLPSWGAFEEARLVVPRASAQQTPRERHRFARAWERAERVVEGARGRSASFQAVHGDAHIGNVLGTRRGAVWTDWEDAFLGPVEIDLACLRSRLDLFGEERSAIEAMFESYDAPFDRDLVRDLALVRNLQVIAWLAVFAERQPELLPRMRARLDKLPPG